MRVLGCFLLLAASLVPAPAATFGTVVSRPEGFTDIVLDEARGRLYLVNTTRNQVDVYAIAQRSFLASIRTAATPLSAALARNGSALYVTCFDASTLDTIDLTRAAPAVTTRVNLPAKPEGVAVGGDDRVLITTIGGGFNSNTLLVYDPRAPAGSNVASVVTVPPPPASPQLPPPSGRIFLSQRSKLAATRDGRFIIGANGSGAGAGTRAVFVYEVVSGTVLRSRSVTNLSSVLTVSPDGSKFMAGPVMFDTETLAVLAQQNAANAEFNFPGGNQNNFNLQQNQGGSVFAPDGSVLYSAFNIAPTQSPAARANVSRFLLNDPDNLLINLGIQLPENLAGKMVITNDGANIYALSESGFVMLPVATIMQNPIAMPESLIAFLANDQCGVLADNRVGTVNVRNIGRGPRLTATATVFQNTPIGPGGLGGFGGPGGGGGFPIIIIPGFPGGAFPGGGGIGAGGPGGLLPGGGGFGGPNNLLSNTTAPSVSTIQSLNGPTFRFGFSPIAARSLGTVTPTDFLIQSPEAINIPPNIRVYQNNRDSDARGKIMPMQVTNLSDGLVDMLQDTARQRLYIANSGKNRIEVFDMRRNVFMDSIKVGQLPRSMAFGTDGVTLYVANTGGESISIVDLDKRQVTGRVKFPPLPFNASFGTITPSVIASSMRGPQIVMSDGTLWKVVGNEAVPRVLNTGIFGSTRTIPAPRTMAATPNGEFVLLLAGNGNAYLYNAQVDDFIVSRSVTNTQGFYGPVAAGPRGSYYLVNGVILNDSLTPIGSTPQIQIGAVGGGALPGRGGQPMTASRPVAAVAAAGNTTFARYSQPIRFGNANTAAAAALTAALPGNDTPMIEIVDVATGFTMRQAPVLEGPAATVPNGNARSNINGRTMAVDAQGTTAYALTTTGLSIIPLNPILPTDRPTVNPNGIVNNANYQPTLAPGSLVSIFGRNLAGSESAPSGTALPTILGNTCLTVNNQPLPLIVTSSGQINTQIPPTMAVGRYSAVVRSLDKQAASIFPAQFTVSKYAPAIFMDGNGQPSILHQDGRPVTKDAPAKRDEKLIIYATGLGVTKGGKVTTGMPAPSNPLAVTDKVQVFFGNPGYKEAEMIVEWSGLVPGSIGIYQLNLRVPGAHLRGNALPVQIRIGGVNSPTTGPAAALVAVD